MEKAKKSLIELGYKVEIFETKEDAKKYLVDTIHKKTIGFGGSMSLEEMGLYEALQEDNDVYWHWRKKDGMNVHEIRSHAITCDCYFSSVNGLSENGEIVNIDGVCNRVASIFYGHEKVYLIVGKNKIAKNLEEAYNRSRNIAAPLNAKRLKVNTPCAIKGDHCYDCRSNDRICRGLSILWNKPTGADIEIILIKENLGY